MNHRSNSARGLASAVALSLALPGAALAQTAPAAGPAAPASTEEEIVVLSPFEVTASESTGYVATTTLAGSRINTQLRDVGSAVSVVTAEFLKDTGATDSKTLLQYTTNTEVASVQGNFTRASTGNQQEEGTFTTPNTNTRVRGLTSADNTRGFFLTDIPWDAYNVDRVDMQRGPNSILFGMGSPAGIINTTTKTAQFRNFGEVEFRYGSYGANRVALDYNHTLLADELAVRVNLVRNDEQYRQKPAYSLDRRLFLTGRYEPKFLNRGEHKTTLKVNFESGSIRSNNPRVITPIDYITPWFGAVGKAVYDPRTVQDNNPHDRYLSDGTVEYFYAPNTGQRQSTLQKNGAGFGGGANPSWQPWLGDFAASFGGLLGFYGPDSDQLQSLALSEFATIGGRSSTGSIDGGLAFPYSRRVAIRGTKDWAENTNQPFAKFGLYKNATLTDSSIFDFYNQLLDGENKSEWQNFHNFSASLSQTFFKQKFGFEAAYDQQRYRNGQFSLLSDQRAGIYVDINSHNLDGTPNANVGKAFISDAGIYGNNSTDVTRESSRLSVYFDHDFNAGGKGAWYRKLLGRHTLSGLYSQDTYQTDNRSFMRWGTDSDYARLVSANYTKQQITNNQRVMEPVIYLGGSSLLGASSAVDARLPNPGAAIVVPSTASMSYFDATWNAPASVGFGDPYTNPFNGVRTTQSENPANYVGWTTVPIKILNAENGDVDALTTGATLQRKKSNSRAVVLQSYFWDGAVVGMYGIRNDIVKSWRKSATTYWDTDNNGSLDTDLARVNWAQADYQLAGDPAVTDMNSPSWSVVAHLTKLLGRWGERIPVNVSLYYNESRNFQVSGTRYNIYGDAIAPQSGRTKDRGILIATKDDRFSLRINKYESNVADANNTSGLNTWFISGGGLFSWGSNYADVFQYHLGNTGDPTSVETPASRSWHWTYSPVGTETTEQAAARAAAAVAGFRALQNNPIVKRYLAAFRYDDLTRIQAHGGAGLTGFALTEDQLSEGYEFELTANPTPSWRVSFNASKVQAKRSNIGGAAFAEFVDTVNTALTTTAAGDLRIWGGSNPNSTTLTTWNSNFYSSYALMRLQEGTFSPELRKWRFNLVTNYDFRGNFLKGVSVGLGYRWQDKVAIGYRPVATADPSVISYDLENPYMGPAEDAVDFWIGYGKKLNGKIDWRIQLNVRNAFDGSKLIPLTTQPDGTVAAWRVAPSQTWTLTNTFKF